MKTIPDFPNYTITKDGRVWSKPRIDALGRKQGGKWLKPGYDTFGYPLFSLCLKNKKITRTGHRLVLETYIGNRPRGLQCRHLNGNLKDNQLSNLCWGTSSENSLDASRHGTHPGFGNKGMEHGMAKLTEKDVRLIFNAYHDGQFIQKELARQFGVSRRHISDIVNKETWKHLWSK